MKGWMSRLAIGMIVLYAALAIGAANCLVLHSEQPTAHHHGHSHLAHSALCAWACQANPTVIIPAVVPSAGTFVVMAMLAFAGTTPPSGIVAAASRSRAPPR
jgi:hypothetical protein